jgi:hypothetical protein
MKCKYIIACFAVLSSFLSCKQSAELKTLTILFPNTPWEYKTNMNNGWIKGNGEICEFADSVLLKDADTITCRVKFELNQPGRLKSYTLKSNLQSDYRIYLNGHEIVQITNYPMPSDICENLTDKKTLKKYTDKISYSTRIKEEIFQRKANELIIVAYNPQPLITGYRPNIQLLAKQKITGRIIFENLRRKSDPSIPVVEINTLEKEIPDEPRIRAHMLISVPPGKKNPKNSDFEYNGMINIELRGSTSQSFPKKSYNIETVDSQNVNLNVGLLGLPAENDWVLYGPYIDKSQIRNALAYSLFGKMGHYTPGTRFCELILNNEYKGIYVFTEKIKRDKNRVNISKLTGNDDSGMNLTGGYIVSLDKNPKGFTWNSKYSGYESTGRTYYNCYYPKSEDMNEAQTQYIMNFIRSFEDYIFKHSDLSFLYDSVIDIRSFIDYFIINELAKNVDAYRLSTYFYKDRDNIDRKLYMGPVWDFNLAFGLPEYFKGYYIDGWIYKENKNIIPFWWQRLLQDQTFRNALENRWIELRSGALSTKSVIRIVDSLANQITTAVDRNYSEFDIIGKDVMWNYFTGSSYTDELNYLKFWLTERLKWMDDNILLLIESELNQISP